MNREIKFRGLRSDSKRWVYGFYSPVNVPILGTLGYCINEYGYRAIDINFESLGQYTGLKDLNGKEIYEGDILQWTSSWKKHDNTDDKGMVYNNVVEYYVGSNYCGYRIKNKSFTKNLTGRNGILNASAIVIGNIYENPELLK